MRILFKIGLMFGNDHADFNITKTSGSDAFKSMEYSANENGFRIEKHQVVTEDGFILEVWRIPGTLIATNVDGEDKPPVLFGLLGDQLHRR